MRLLRLLPAAELVIDGEERDLRERILVFLDNRRIARVAKLAGAPRAPSAGIELHVRLGQRVDPDEPLYTVHAEAPGELQYALSYAARQLDIVRVEEQ